MKTKSYSIRHGHLVNVNVEIYFYSYERAAAGVDSKTHFESSSFNPEDAVRSLSSSFFFFCKFLKTIGK